MEDQPLQTLVVMLAGYIAFSWAVAVVWIGWLLLRKSSRKARIEARRSPASSPRQLGLSRT